MEDNIRKIEVTILLPCFNEEEALRTVIPDIQNVMNKTRYSYDILIIDDNSTDNSFAVAKEMGARVIRHSSNKGAGGSRKTGILAAQGEIIVMLDADGTYTPSDIPKMLDLFPEFDQVNGARDSEKGTLAFLRKPAKLLIRLLASFLAGRLIPDLNTGLKAFKKDMMIPYLWTVPDGFSCVSSMTLAFLCNGHSVKYIPTKYHKRIGKSKFHPIKDTYLYILTVLRLIMYFNPLKVFLPIAFLLLTGGVLKSIYDYIWIIHRLQLSDIVIIISGIVIGLQGLVADLIVAQARAKSNNILVKKISTSISEGFDGDNI